MSWIAYYDDNYLVHYSLKIDIYWFPKKPRKKKHSKRYNPKYDPGNPNYSPWPDYDIEEETFSREYDTLAAKILKQYSPEESAKEDIKYRITGTTPRSKRHEQILKANAARRSNERRRSQSLPLTRTLIDSPLLVEDIFISESSSEDDGLKL